MGLVQHRPADQRTVAAVLPPLQAPSRPRRPAWLATAALPPPDESQRLAELRGFGILDTEPDEDYERLVQLAAALCGTPPTAIPATTSHAMAFSSISVTGSTKATGAGKTWPTSYLMIINRVNK